MTYKFTYIIEDEFYLKSVDFGERDGPSSEEWTHL